MNTDFLLNVTCSPDMCSVVTVESQEEEKWNKNGGSAILHPCLDFPHKNSVEHRGIARFRAAVNKAYHILKSLGFTYDEAIGSIFRTLAPRCTEFAEDRYRAVMEKEIAKLKFSGVTNDEDIIMLFIGRLESSIKVMNKEYLRYAKKRNMIPYSPIEESNSKRAKPSTDNTST
eukprot:TRINITY_DN10496_c0_g2_i2.p2 TRINITY_DN10496_c0_g2~~TRINITY_DN10496_c0_g2_i2.p2  ORF type:complete len:173 (-),score=36.20 TRINITY_DN10496_c0_g2_i2:175-693(-)